MPIAPDSQIEFEPWMHAFTAANGARFCGLSTDSVGALGSYAFVADPGGGGRLVLRYAAQSAGVIRAHVLNVTSGELGDTVSLTDTYGDLWFECEMRLDWNSEASSFKVLTFFKFLNDAATVALAQISMANGGNCRIDVDSNGNSASSGGITQNTWKLMRGHYRASTGTSDGIAELWIGNLDGSGMTLVHSHAHNNTTKVGRVWFGCQDTGFAGSIAAYVATISIMRQSTIDRFNLENEAWCVKDGGLPFCTCGLSQTEAGFAVHWHPSVYDDAWTVADDVECDIEYVIGDYNDTSFPAAGTSTAAGCPLPSADEFCGSFTISGLTANTLYSARLRTYRAAAPGTKRDGPVFQFRTLPAVATTLEFVHAFCQKVAVMNPLSPGVMAAEGNAIDFEVFSGDWYYLDRSAATYYPTSFAPVQTQQEWLRDVPLSTIMLSRFQILSARKHAILIQQDDHDACEDNWNAGYVKGFVTASNPLGSDGLDRAQLCTDVDLNAAGITRGQLYDYAQEGWYKLFGRGHIGVAYPGASWHDRADHRKIETGASLFAFLDTRRFQDDVGNQPFSGGAQTFLGADQLAYWLDQFQTTTKENVLIFSPANISDANLIAGDSWQDRAWRRAEWHQIEAALMANQNVRRVYLFSGDRHATIVDRRSKDGQYGRAGTSFDKMVGHFRIGPLASGTHLGGVPTEDVIYSGNFGATQQGEPSKGYGRFTLNEATGIIFWSAINDLGETLASGSLGTSPSVAQCSLDRATAFRTTLSIQEEITWGTRDAGQSPLGIDYVSESLHSDDSRTEEQIILTGGRQIEQTRQTLHRPSGEIVGELMMSGAWPLIVRHALGGDVVTSGSGPYTHTMEGGPLPTGLTIQKLFSFRSGDQIGLHYLGAKIQSFNLSLTTEGQVRCRAVFAARREIEADLADLFVSPLYPLIDEPLNVMNASLVPDSPSLAVGEVVVASITELSLTIENNLNENVFSPEDSRYRHRLPEGARVVSGSMTAFFTPEAFDLYRALRSDQSISINLELAQGAHEWTWLVRHIVLRANATPMVAARGPLFVPATFIAEPADGEPDLEVQIINDDPELSTG